jgi:hypothetical protein
VFHSLETSYSTFNSFPCSLTSKDLLYTPGDLSALSLPKIVSGPAVEATKVPTGTKPYGASNNLAHRTLHYSSSNSIQPSNLSSHTVEINYTNVLLKFDEYYVSLCVSQRCERLCEILHLSRFMLVLKTVFATGSPMMRTFDKKKLGKRPPPFPHIPWKNLGRRVCVDSVEHIFYDVNREFFWGDFKNMTGRVRSQIQEEKTV